MSKIILPPRFAANCLMGLLYHLEQTYNIIYHGDHVEIVGPDPLQALHDVLTTARQIIEDKEAGKMLIRVPASGNDKKVLNGIWKAYRLGTDATVIDFIKVVQENLNASTEEKHRLPSLLKPEYYEFNRQPGYLDESSRKMLDLFPVLSASLSLIGYFVCKVGNAQIDKGVWVSVVVTPEIQSSSQPYAIDPDYRLLTFVNPARLLNNYMQTRKYNFAGLFPEAALHLWLATHMGGAKINLFALKEPFGQNPATIYSSLKIDLGSIHNNLYRYGLKDEAPKNYLLYILENALRAGEKSVAKHLSVRLSILLYEVLAGMKPVEEFVYAASREYLPWSSSPPSRDDPMFKGYQVSRWAARLAGYLMKTVDRGR